MLDASQRKANRNNSFANLSIQSGNTAVPVMATTPQLGSVAFGSGAGKGNEPGLSMGIQAKKRLANLSIPSIPSRFLTPVLKFDLHEKEEQQQAHQQVTESVLVAKVARLTNDGSNVGPGHYNIDQAYKANSPSPRGGDNWMVNKTKRQDIFVQKSTQKSVGPGSYSIDASQSRHTINQPTIPRAERSKFFSDRFGPRKKKRNNGSIRANWEEGDSDEEDNSPGPGAHL